MFQKLFWPGAAVHMKITEVKLKEEEKVSLWNDLMAKPIETMTSHKIYHQLTKRLCLGNSVILLFPSIHIII